MAGIIPSSYTLDDLDLKVATTGGTTYVGQAAIGSATSQAVWQIMRIVVAGTDVAITWADSDNNFDNIWDNRASIVYG